MRSCLGVLYSQNLENLTKESNLIRGKLLGRQANYTITILTFTATTNFPHKALLNFLLQL